MRLCRSRIDGCAWEMGLEVRWEEESFESGQSGLLSQRSV